MKLSGMKNMNWKQVLLDHGEKVALGAVGLLGLAALGMSRWAPYKEKDPFVIAQQVREAEAQHKASTWPDSEQEEYKDVENIAQKAQNLLAGIDGARLDFGRTLDVLYWPIIPPKQPIEEPRWFPVKQLIADSGYLLYEKAVAYDPTLLAEDGSMLPPGTVAANEPQPTGDGLDDFRPSARPLGAAGGEAMDSGYAPPGYSPPGMAGGRGGAAGGRGGAAGGRGGAAPGMTAAGGRGGAPGGRGGAAGGRGGSYEGAMPGMDSGYGMDGGYGMAGTAVEGVAKRYIAIRGVFPLKQQEEELARARSQSRGEVAGLLQFTDFELERQKAIAGPDPWGGEWRKVDIQVANDVLNDQARFDYDEVDPTVTNAVFTMPLPGRVMGNWTQTGTHPLLTQYDQSPEFQKRQEKLQQLIADYAAELERQKKLLPQLGGFATQMWDAGQVGRAMVEDAEYMSAMGPGAMGMPGQNGQQEVTLTKDDIKALITASGTYVLFRYIDFDVQPGNAYRYRVRLKLFNPNFGLPIDQVARADVAEDQYRWTEWSEPSEPAVMKEDTRRYLASIEPGSVRQPERARFDLYQWSTETGATVNASLPVEPGQFIAGTQPADVLDVAGQTFENKDFAFTSGDMLVDIDRSPPGLPSVRPELKLGRKFEVPAQVLVVNEAGQLEVQDPYTDAAARAAAKSRQEAIAGFYDYLKNAVAAVAEGGDLYGGEYGSMEEGGGRGGAAANPLRRGRRNRGAAAMGSGMVEGGMPGEAGPTPRRRR